MNPRGALGFSAVLVSSVRDLTTGDTNIQDLEDLKGFSKTLCQFGPLGVAVASFSGLSLATEPLRYATISEHVGQPERADEIASGSGRSGRHFV